MAELFASASSEGGVTRCPSCRTAFRVHAEQLAQHGVFVRPPEIHEVSGESHGVRFLLQGHQVPDARAQHPGGVHDPVREFPGRLDVHIADLRQQEGLFHAVLSRP